MSSFPKLNYGKLKNQEVFYLWSQWLRPSYLGGKNQEDGGSRPAQAPPKKKS
jgi:hypothetical protein